MNPTAQLDEVRPASVRPYVCWLIVLVLGFYDLVYVREVMISLFLVVGIKANLMLLLDKIGFFLFGVFGLLIILISEPYLRRGWQCRCLIQRFFLLLSLGFGVLTIFWAMLMGLPGLSGAARPTIAELSVVTAALVVSALLNRNQAGQD